MIFLNCPFLPNVKCFNLDSKESMSCRNLSAIVQDLSGVPGEHFSIFRGCHKVSPNEIIEDGATVFLGLTLPGGKGGFGSMLRAIGAQIEKTTNREACRDLTGRRLRDINEEQRLKKWLLKKAERELESTRKKKERLERLKRQPKHDFHDPEYNKQRSELPERIDDALNQGLQKAVPGRKRTAQRRVEDDYDDEIKELLKKKCLQLGLDVPSSTSESSYLESGSDTESNSGPSQMDETSNTGQKSEEISEDVLVAGASCSDNGQNSSTSERLRKDDNDHSTGCSSNSTNIEGLVGDGTKEEVPKDDSELENDSKNEEKMNDEKISPNDDNSLVSDASKKEPKLVICDENSSEIQGGQPQNSQLKDEDVGSIDLMSYNDVKELESLGLDKLKSVLMSLGLKCGGTLTERAQRLWSIRGVDPKDFPSSLKAKPKKK